MKRSAVIKFSIVFLLIGCTNREEEIKEKQAFSCIEDIKQGLNDPNSLELLSSVFLDEKPGSYRISVEYTAANHYGGKERSKATCGFISKDSTELDPNDFQNGMRSMNNNFRSLNAR